MKPNTERLRKLADHLISGKLGHERFDFNQYNSSDFNTCGTAGCAIGECPIVWPDEWIFDGVGSPVMKGEDLEATSGEKFFNLEHRQYTHLFLPNCQNPSTYGGDPLTEYATKEQVANNILEFCKRYD